jgi:mRNA interferase MazF
MKQELRRFDIILVDFGNDVIGSEQGGKRPAIIIQNDCGNIHSPTTIVMPCTSKIKNPNQPTHTLIKQDKNKGLIEDSMVLGEAMRQVSEKRIIKLLGKIDNSVEQEEIKRVYFANFGD